MLNAQELKAALSDEIRIIRHLGTKLDSAKMDWRPTEGQRSTIELLRYMALCGIAPVKAMAAGDWGVAKEMDKLVADMGLADFDAAMASQEEALHTTLDDLGDAKLAEQMVKLPWGVTQPLGQAIFSTSLRFLCAYRLQLFLYAKQGGGNDLSTFNAWMGSDPPKK
ncbi:MAG: hypothetical protein ACI8QS_003032 [Planctomycetota bacterium]|jgi:hypothetical protein